ncbi:unnamed protein product [Spodoptera exigua]|nr:hypothetical protein HW555_012653 [Spodoptera exigua]CAH0697054.1 unnamed protein product [Spodoptera exigua]
MSKCNKVKNPCKICLGPVTNKNGLQCHGACQSWAHYNCLNYTPGKIKDIKAGIIKVTCPCPDCRTSMPKEYRTDTPYSCNNSQCPANRPPKCDNTQCPINSDQKCGRPKAPSCALGTCGTDCKQYSSSHQMDGCPPPPLPPPCNRYGTVSPITSSDACLTDRCPSGCSSQNDVHGDAGMFQMSGSTPSFHVVEQMCNTVGQLTNQINELMMQMKEAVNCNRGGCCPPPPKATCQQKGPKSLCPKPCFCPGNPARRNC